MLGCNRFNKLLQKHNIINGSDAQSRWTRRDKSSNSSGMNIKFILLFCLDGLYERQMIQLFAALDSTWQILRRQTCIYNMKYERMTDSFKFLHKINYEQPSPPFFLGQVSCVGEKISKKKLMLTQCTELWEQDTQEVGMGLLFMHIHAAY